MIVRVETCSVAQRDHNKSIRQYAHTFCRGRAINTVCVCDEFFDLPRGYFDGILAHEVGHLIAGPSLGEDGADLAILAALGIKIVYKDSPHGRRLEWITIQDARKLYRAVDFIY